MQRVSCMPIMTLCLSIAGCAAATAQEYPARPIRLVIPFAPGGSVDLIARTVASGLTKRLGQQVQPDNRGGAGATIGTEIVANAPPDGYTLLQMSLSHAVNPAVYKLKYDPIKAFTPIVFLGSGPSVLTVHPSLPANSVGELIALAKQKPGQLIAANAGIGSFTHTAGVLFSMMAGVDIQQVPFKGGGPAMIDVVGGHSQVLFNSYVASQPHVVSGKLKALGVTGTARTSLFPTVPTIAESGVPGYELGAWTAVFAPAGMPRPVVDRLNALFRTAIDTPSFKEQSAQSGAVLFPGTPEELGAFQRAEIEKWARIVKAAGMQEP